MLTHLAEGTVRRYLDEPAAVSDADRSHLDGCERCRSELARARDDRDLVARALSTRASDLSTDVSDLSADVSDLSDRARLGRDPVDPDPAWARLCRQLEEPAEPTESQRVSRRPAPVGAVPVGGWRRRRPLVEAVVRRPLAAVVAAGVVVLGGGAAAAAVDWLPIFQAKKVTPVQVSPQDLGNVDQLLGQAVRFAELSAFGDVVGPKDVQPSVVPDAATAAARTGLTVPRVGALPTGVEGRPTYYVADRHTVEFTFSAAKAAQSAQARGTALPPMPAGLDGTRLRVEGGPGVAQVWGQRSGMPTLVVARAKAPTAATRGASLPVVRDYLLSLPGISPQLAAQLRTVTGDGTTLPIPVPTDLATSSQADVGGVQATVVEARNRFATAVIWVDGGELNVVLGPLGRGEVLAVARGLR